MGIIQCGSFTGNTTVNIGWEPQWIMIKRTDAAGDWIVIDSMRGCSVGGVDAVLNPNLANAESVSNDYIDFTATGFITKNLTGTYIYTVIRRPNKPPKTGAEVYNAIARTGTGAAATVTGVGFAPDLYWVNRRSVNAERTLTVDRLRGSMWLFSNLTAVETTNTTLFPVNPFGVTMDGVRVGAGDNLNNFYDYIDHFFRRATGFMDVVCDTGTGSAHTVSHNLTVAPELLIRKGRSGATQWEVWHSALAASEKLVLNSTAAKVTDATAWNSTAPTASVFTVGTGTNVNTNAATYVTYLFATLAGISKCGSYTGNGTSQTINCGFTTGARFFLVKAISTTGSWWVFDSARGIVSAADAALQLNSTAAEITSADAVDPDPSGIIVNQEATCSINATGVSYVFLAIS